MFYVKDEGQNGPYGIFSTTHMTTETVKGGNNKEEDQENPMDPAAMDPFAVP